MNQINTDTTTSSSFYEFQAPSNMVAIRSNIIQRIKQQKTSRRHSTSPSPLHSTKSNNEYNSSFSVLDNGLPSPPIETCLYEEEEEESKLPTEMVVNALMELTQEMPPSPVMSKASSNSGDSDQVMETVEEPLLESSEVYREKIRLLKEEKHKLFQVMKNLLSKPVQAPASVPATAAPVAIQAPLPPPSSSSCSSSSNTTMTTTAPTTTSNRESQQLKSRPIARSRSISHTDSALNTRPISRYYSNSASSPSSRYSYCPYNRISYTASSQPPSPSSSSSLLNMSRRISNNSSTSPSSSYVTSRPTQQQAATSMTKTTSSGAFYRLPSCSSSHHSRY